MSSVAAGLVLAVFLFGAAGAAEEKSMEDAVPRILLVGDSWAGFMYAFSSLDSVAPQFGLERWVQVGNETAIMGSKASQWVLQPEKQEALIRMLDLYPTVDIVHLSLSGNDFLFGSETLPGKPRWRPSQTPAENEAIFDNIVADIRTIIELILGHRPDIRIAICGYTYGHRDLGGTTVEQGQLAFAALEQKKLALAGEYDRVEYVHNLGLMQHLYGITDAEPPIAAGVAPFPGSYPDYLPFPGGLPPYKAPVAMFIDENIHLNQPGYEDVARRCFDEFYEEWLDYPRALEILPGAPAGSQITFQVTFSEAVSGVDTADFSAIAGAKSLPIVTVSGAGAVYEVTAAIQSGTIPVLTVLDNDSISDGTWPLGGSGLGNGTFSVNAPFTYVPPGPPAPTDFDTALNSLDSAASPYAGEINGFRFAPELCDANGDIDVANLLILGNGLLDSREFALIEACVNDPALDFTDIGGVSHSIAVQAWENNYTRMRADLGGDGSLGDILLPGLDTVLAGYMTLGDPKSSLLPVLLLAALSAVDDFPTGVSIPIVAQYVLLPQYFGLNGDADGDGYTNKQEYAWFGPDKTAYVAAALDPRVLPAPDCPSPGGGLYEVGDNLCIAVPDPVAAESNFQWSKDGVPLVNDDRIFGATRRQLNIANMMLEDSGLYQCTYDDGSKVPAEYTVYVEIAEQVPLLGGLAIVGLLLGIGAAGARRLRR
jgi:hypothetical protein